MTLYRRGHEWWYHFWFEGKHIQRPTRTTSKKLARQLEIRHRNQLIEEKHGLRPAEDRPKDSPDRQPSLFSDFARRYLEFSRANKRAYGVEVYYIRRTLVPFFGRWCLNEITPLHVEDFKARRLKDGLKKSSVNRELGLLKSMLNTAVKWGLAERNGAREVKLLRLDDTPSNRVLSYEEEGKLLAACEEAELRCRAPHLKAVILVALYTGLRRGEVLRLRWQDIDFDDGVLVVQRSKTRAGQGRRVNLNSVLRDLLLELRQESDSEWVFPSPNRFQEAYSPQRPLGDVKHAFCRAVKLAGIPPITFHQLRHTFCSRLADAGVPLPVIQELAGHSSITMTRRYTHPASELKQKAVELLLQGRKEPEVARKSARPAVADRLAPEKQRGQVVVFRKVAQRSKAGKEAQTATS